MHVMAFLFCWRKLRLNVMIPIIYCENLVKYRDIIFEHLLLTRTCFQAYIQIYFYILLLGIHA